MEPDLELLRRYLDSRKPYERIHLNLFSQGLASPGVVPIQAWRDLVRSRALRQGELVGIDQDAYPADTGSSLRYQPAFEALAPRHPLPAPLSHEAIDQFLDQADNGYPVRWT